MLNLPQQRWTVTHNAPLFHIILHKQDVPSLYKLASQRNKMNAFKRRFERLILRYLFYEVSRYLSTTLKKRLYIEKAERTKDF